MGNVCIAHAPCGVGLGKGVGMSAGTGVKVGDGVCVGMKNSTLMAGGSGEEPHAISIMLMPVSTTHPRITRPFMSLRRHGTATPTVPVTTLPYALLTATVTVFEPVTTQVKLTLLLAPLTLLFATLD